MTDTGRAIRRIVFIAFLTAILETAKFALNAIANVELITLLIIIFTRRFGTRMMLAVCLVFTMLECMWWGISIWTVTYFYVWPLLVWISVWLAKEDSVLLKSVIAGVFGLLFGMLCALTTFVTAGFNAAVSWWVAGIPFDLVHGISNFLLCLLLYRPLARALDAVRTETQYAAEK